MRSETATLVPPLAPMKPTRRVLGGICAADERSKDDAGAIQNLGVRHGGMTAHGAGYPAHWRMWAEHRAQEAE
jgi:hypothetical protein